MTAYKVEICGVNTARLPMLREQEKEELMAALKKGDEAARQKYIKGNLRLVLSVVQRFSASGENLPMSRFLSKISGGMGNLCGLSMPTSLN